MVNDGCANLESATAPRPGTIPFTEIPHSTRLFTDFLYDFDRVSRFYTDCGRAASSLTNHAREVASREYSRGEVAAALDRINRSYDAPAATLKNIERLAAPGSVAIVTGQQAGLLTGPLYTIHKALTTIKLAACLRDQGVDAVPVFWIASEDHDYPEVNHARLVDTDGKVVSVTYESKTRRDDVPVGHIRICDGITSTINEFIASLPRSEFVGDIEKDLRECYSEGVGFAEAFGRLLTRLFGKYGVVMLDPLDEGLKQAAGPLYVRALERSDRIAAALVERSRQLEEAGYHAQIHVSEDMVPLFIMDDGRRSALHRHEGRFLVKGSERSFSAADLEALASRCPNCFSPNVTLRPVVQDYLLPTAAYIGGPAEIAYFAQLAAVYEALERPLPCVLPRASLTIIEGRHQKTLKKYGLVFPDFYEGLHNAVTKVVEQSLDRGTANAFANVEGEINSQLDALQAALSRSDSTLAASLNRARSKILYQLEHLRTRYIHAAAHREETTYRQIERAFTTLFPNRNLQERELNVYFFLSRYGPGLIDELYEAVEDGFSNHLLLNIGGVASQVVNAR